MFTYNSHCSNVKIVFNGVTLFIDPSFVARCWTVFAGLYYYSFIEHNFQTAQTHGTITYSQKFLVHLRHSEQLEGGLVLDP